MNRRYVMVGCFLVVILVGGMLFVKKQFGVTASPEEEVSGDKVMGPPDAPVQIVEYSDYQCPACSYAHKIMTALLASYPGKIRLIYHHYPLMGHVWSPIAHQAAQCAFEQNRFWEYHDKLFANQLVWSTPVNPVEKFLTYAKELDLNLDAFAACLQDEAVKRKVQEDRERGQALKIESTPTFFFNGERLVGGRQLTEKGENIIRVAVGLPPKVIPSPSPSPQVLPSAVPQDLKQTEKGGVLPEKEAGNHVP